MIQNQLMELRPVHTGMSLLHKTQITQRELDVTYSISFFIKKEKDISPAIGPETLSQL